MVSEIEEKRFKNLKMYVLTALLFLCIIIFISLAIAIPTPHNIEGRVFTNGSNGVENGIPVTINNTVGGDYVLTFTYAPDIPELLGSYSATINGSDGHLIIATAWNLTYYGRANTTLLTTTTNLDIVLNITRPSEANVTILYPPNDTLKNKTIIFNVTANVSMLGYYGIDCNATINFSDNSILNITSNENLTHYLGNISGGNFKVLNWSVIGLNEGSSNITVRIKCISDGIKLDNPNLSAFSVFNISIQNLAPAIGSPIIKYPIDLIAGANLTMFCNATINDSNTASDIKSVNATFYISSFRYDMPDDNNYHYTNSSCVNVSSSVFQANYSCGFKIAYYANNGTWQCNISAMDYSNVSVLTNISTYINELMAIDISPTIIDYGTLKATNISSTDFNVTIKNFGNIPINITVKGYAPNESLSYLNLSMTCQNGNISNANQRFSTMNGTDFTRMTLLNNETQLINFTLQQRTDDFAFGNDTNSTFWKLQVPPLTLGSCNGTVVFSAITI